MQYTDCVDVASATLSTNVEGRTLDTADCGGLATAVADKQIAEWKTALPRITQTGLEADHERMLRSDGGQIAQLSLRVAAAALGAG